MILLPSAAWAQLAVGGWTLHTPFRDVETIVETSEYVYYTSQGALFRVDKETIEVQSLNISTLLNDGNVSGLYVARDGKSLLVTYATGNMDRIFDNGKVVNIPDIKDAVMTTSRAINHVDFGDDCFFVATDFGLVIYDNKKNEVKRTIYTSSPVKFAIAAGDHVGIMIDKKLLFAKNDNSLVSAEKFQPLAGDNGAVTWHSVKGAGDRWLYLISFHDNSYYLNKGTLDFENGTITFEDKGIHGFTNEINVCRNGIYACNFGGAYIIDHDGNESVVEKIMKSSDKKMSYFDSDRQSWISDSEGIRLVDVTSGDVITDTSKPSQLTVVTPSTMHVGASGKVYVYNLGEHLTFKLPETAKRHMYVNVLGSGNKIYDVTPVDVTVVNKSSNYFTPDAPHHVVYGMRIFEDPSDPDALYIGSMLEGCYRVKNGVQTHKFDQNTAGIVKSAKGWAYPVSAPIVDRKGNLWLYQFTDEEGSQNRLHYLPASKRTKDEIAPSDWVHHSFYVKELRDAFGLACKQSDNVLIFPGRYNTNLIVVNYKGTESSDDDVITIVDSFVDQDNKKLSYYHTICAVEDLKGRIWVGTDNGVFEITDPTKISGTTARVNHLKVPRNDGTNLADYLLDSQTVTAIAVDNSNRKWISTLSGVYLVNETGDEILEHYTTSNSILPSNTVYSVACDPTSSSVFFGTPQGVVEYNSTSSPGREDYSDVVAYPNPVRPDYTGWITIKGLMDDSLVKIADAAGNVFHQGRSNGGMFMWDGCNSSGERVKTGVYYVFASQNATGSNQACVTKIMVVN